MDKERREELEYKSLFEDERYAKRAWKKIIAGSLQSEAAVLPTIVDKNGNTSPQNELDIMAYNNVKRRLEAEGKSRKPMQAELIVENAILRSRFNDSAFNMLLERTAGKVKDEIAVSASQYEEMTDDELEALQAYREQKLLAEAQKQTED